MRTGKFLTLGLAAMLMLAGCGNQTQETSAAKEGVQAPTGTLSFYTSQPDEDAAALVKGFNAKYPEVKVEVFRSGTEEVMSKIQAENQAGEVQADVLLVADAVTFESLKQQNMLLSYRSPEADKIPAGFVDADGAYSGTKVMATALVVNTKTGNLPDSWSVLSDPATKGQSLMPSPLYSGAAAYNLGVFTRTNEFGWDFYQAMKANEVTVTKGNGAVLKAVAGGEKNYGMVVDFIVARAKAEGSPVELVYPKEGVPVITEPIGIMSQTKNEIAAKAFVDFVLSQEGQELAAALGYTPIREGVKAPEGLKSIREIRVLEGKIAELYQSRDQDKQEFSRIFE
ncbi:ABC transporter substrate-binding protein [Ammoniphilus sp. YIM 78166]|uniref:ABC transporter substrate-binding protein n=1 Tax=Ammoniphilus sp. YIM 78166 TaxID=1644106 RepID=UPI00106F65F5|nr:ABC transporter substrate-binding protein [Ammoniphilus sp. YIM 78166]